MIIVPALWTFALILNVISCISGGTATWLGVFAPLICITINSWYDLFK